MKATKPVLKTTAWSVAVVVGIAGVGFLLQLVATSTAVPSQSVPQGDVSAARATWVQFLGVAGLFVGFIYTSMSYRLSRQSRTTDALISAVRDLGDNESDVRRIGGIYAMSVLVAQEPSTRDDVERLLAAFVRQYARDVSAQSQQEVIGALKLIAGRPEGSGVRSPRIDLRRVHLEGVNLYGARLENCDLSGAHLDNADLTDAKLVNSILSGSSLDGAHLRGSNLRDAQLDNCSVSKTDFYAAVTDGMNTDGTDMTLALNYVIRPQEPQ